MQLTYQRLFTILFLLSFKSGVSQGLQIGQTIPNYSFKNVLNFRRDSISMSDFKGKLVIFDFWSFNCASCLKSFSKIDSLQRQFNNRIQFLLVNRDSKEKTREFFEKRKKLKMPVNVPLITTDSILNDILPHQGVPFYAWLDGNAKLVYLTHEQITAEKILLHLAGDSMLYRKAVNTRYVKTIFNKPFETYVQYSTSIIKGIDTLNLHIEIPGDNIAYDCQSIENLYQFAYNESEIDGPFQFREPGRTILEVDDIEKYRYLPGKNYEDWQGKYGYYYQSILPESLKKDKYRIMQEDLKRFFGLDVKIEKRNVRCLALIRTSGKDKLKTKGGKSSQTAFSIELRVKDGDERYPPVRYIRNMPFKNLFNTVQDFGIWRFGVKVVDSTGYSGNIDFEVHEKKLENLTIEGLRDILNKYDLDLIEKGILMDVLVLRERK